MRQLTLVSFLLSLGYPLATNQPIVVHDPEISLHVVIPIASTPQVLGKHHLSAIFVTLMGRLKSGQYCAILIQQY